MYLIEKNAIVIFFLKQKKDPESHNPHSDQAKTLK